MNNIIISPLVATLIMAIIFYFLSYVTHLHMTKDHANSHDFILKKTNFKNFKKLFDQQLWRTKEYRGSFFPYKETKIEDIGLNYIHADRISINGIGYRLKWYSWLSFIIWRNLKYKPNPNLLMAYL